MSMTVIEHVAKTDAVREICDWVYGREGIEMAVHHVPQQETQSWQEQLQLICSDCTQTAQCMQMMLA